MKNIFKKLFCKHKYQYFYRTVEYSNWVDSFGYYNFHFVCPACGKSTIVSQLEIEKSIKQLAFQYYKDFALNKQLEPVKSTEFILPCRVTDKYFNSPAVTLLFESYEQDGIDLRQIENKIENKSENTLLICNNHYMSTTTHKNII